MKKQKRISMVRTVILVVVVLALAGVAGLSTVAYAQAARASVSAARPHSFFDPFGLTRVMLSGDDSAGTVVFARNGNGNGPPDWVPGPPICVPARPVCRSSWCPPFGVARGRNGF